MFSANELETIMEYWQDISQDPEYISRELNMNIKKVNQILSELQSNGDIEGYILEEGAVNPEMSRILNLSQFSKDEKYFFKKKNIGMFYDKHIFLIEVDIMKMVDDNTAVEAGAPLSPAAGPSSGAAASPQRPRS